MSKPIEVEDEKTLEYWKGFNEGTVKADFAFSGYFDRSNKTQLKVQKLNLVIIGLLVTNFIMQTTLWVLNKLP